LIQHECVLQEVAYIGREGNGTPTNAILFVGRTNRQPRNVAVKVLFGVNNAMTSHEILNNIQHMCSSDHLPCIMMLESYTYVGSTAFLVMDRITHTWQEAHKKNNKAIRVRYDDALRMLVCLIFTARQFERSNISDELHAGNVFVQDIPKEEEKFIFWKARQQYFVFGGKVARAGDFGISKIGCGPRVEGWTIGKVFQLWQDLKIEDAMIVRRRCDMKSMCQACDGCRSTGQLAKKILALSIFDRFFVTFPPAPNLFPPAPGRARSHERPINHEWKPS